MLYIFVSIYVFMTFKHMFSLNKKKKKTLFTIFFFFFFFLLFSCCYFYLFVVVVLVVAAAAAVVVSKQKADRIGSSLSSQSSGRNLSPARWQFFSDVL